MDLAPPFARAVDLLVREHVPVMLDALELPGKADTLRAVAPIVDATTLAAAAGPVGDILELDLVRHHHDPSGHAAPHNSPAFRHYAASHLGYPVGRLLLTPPRTVDQVTSAVEDLHIYFAHAVRSLESAPSPDAGDPEGQRLRASGAAEAYLRRSRGFIGFNDAAVRNLARSVLEQAGLVEPPVSRLDAALAGFAASRLEARRTSQPHSPARPGRTVEGP